MADNSARRIRLPVWVTWALIWGLPGFAIGAGNLFLDIRRAFVVFNEDDAGHLVLLGALLACVIIGLIWLPLSIYYLVRRSWEDAALNFLTPLTFPLTVVCVDSVSAFSPISPRFLLSKSAMERQVGQAAYAEFPWRMRDYEVQTLVFDRTDTFPERVASGETHWPNDCTTVASMGDHFFIATLDSLNHDYPKPSSVTCMGKPATASQ